jgi:hypothetical protein
MSLLKPTPGEVIDRISILRLKADAYLKAGKPTERLNLETTELCLYLDTLGRHSEVTPIAFELADINESLWKAEDYIRVEAMSEHEVSKTALEIVRLNDRRMQLVREIDKVYGLQSVEEKIYS